MGSESMKITHVAVLASAQWTSIVFIEWGCGAPGGGCVKQAQQGQSMVKPDIGQAGIVSIMEAMV